MPPHTTMFPRRRTVYLQLQADDLLWRPTIESMTSASRLTEAISETTMEADACAQNLPKTLQTLVQPTWEFPYLPNTPNAAAAPLPEKRSPTMTASKMEMGRIDPLVLRLFRTTTASDHAEYANAIALATMKYLHACR